MNYLKVNALPHYAIIQLPDVENMPIYKFSTEKNNNK